MTVTITDDRRGFDQFVVQLKRLDGFGAFVGVFEGSGDDSESPGLTHVELALIHEFGLGDLPRRPFLTAWLEQNRALVAEITTAEVKKGIARGGDPLRALDRVAAWAAGQVQKLIAGNNVRPPTSDATNKRKEKNGRPGSTTLIDTGELRRSIEGKVRAIGGK